MSTYFCLINFDQPQVITRTNNPIAKMNGNNNVLSNKKIMKFCTPIFPHKKKECFPQPFNLAITQKTKSSSILYFSQKKTFDTINVKADTFSEILLPLRHAKYYTFNRHSVEEVIRCLSNSPALPDDLGVLITGGWSIIKSIFQIKN